MFNLPILSKQTVLSLPSHSICDISLFFVTSHKEKLKYRGKADIHITRRADPYLIKKYGQILALSLLPDPDGGKLPEWIDYDSSDFLPNGVIINDGHKLVIHQMIDSQHPSLFENCQSPNRYEVSFTVETLTDDTILMAQMIEEQFSASNVVVTLCPPNPLKEHTHYDS